MKSHLPVYGVGPLYVWTIMLMSVAAIALDYFGVIPHVELDPGNVVRWVAFGVLCALGLYIWVSAVVLSHIEKEIVSNHLCTSGIYKYVRNPIYTALMFIAWALLLVPNNALLIALAPLYWLFMAVLMKCTEEKWLADLYGDEYRAYCKCTNRTIPWFPKKGDRS